MQLASRARLFRSTDGRFFAQVPVGDRLEIYGLKSAGFRDWLIDGHVVHLPEPPSEWTIRRVVGMLLAHVWGEEVLVRGMRGRTWLVFPGFPNDPPVFF